MPIPADRAVIPSRRRLQTVRSFHGAACSLVIASIIGGAGGGIPRQADALSVVGIEGPARASSERSCYELAAEISGLLEARSGTAGFWSRADNQFAGVMTVVAPVPAVAYLGYNAFDALKEDQNAATAASRIRALRKRSAEQRCFER